MKGFIAGVLTGVLVKDRLCNWVFKLLEAKASLHKPRNKCKIFVLAKIADKIIFDEMFPVLPTKFRTQPHWDFYENKHIIKIPVDEPVNFEKEITFDDFLINNTTLDIEFFKEFSELSVYIHYTIDNKEYINVYTKDSVIKSQDFVLNDTTLSQKYNRVVCATFQINGKEMYITNYFKKFLNNTCPIRTEHLLLYYDALDRVDAKLQIINNGNVTIHQLYESI
jgi:hypothetical protein